MKQHSVPFRYAVCGLGPAGIGYLCACYRAGFLPAMIEDGLLMIDLKTESGGGALQHYKITANTTAATFLECMEGDHANIFASLSDAEAALVTKLQDVADQPVDLKIAGALLQLIGRKILAYTQQLGAHLLNNARLESIAVQAEAPLYRLELIDNTSGASQTMIAENVLLNFGAKQKSSDIQDYLARQFNHAGAAMNQKLLIADELLQAEQSVLAEKVRGWQKALILGSSHSSMSVVERLVNVAKIGTEFRIGIIYRSPIRLFFSSAEEARAVGYEFDPVNDLCPLSGGVNRFGGLRFAAKRIGAQILNYASAGDAVIPVDLFQIDQLNEQELLGQVQDADVVIPCIGYSPVRPSIVNSDGREVDIASDGFGYKVSDIGELYTQDGKKLNGLFSFGLGAGQHASDEIGGEKSFKKRVDGVWLYHFDIGQKVANAIFSRR